MHILVTGGAGFIGSHLVHWLLEQGHHIRVLDNLSSGRRDMLGPALNSIEFIEGDIRDMAAVQSAMTDIELVFHLAALVSVVESIEYPLRAQDVNATGTLHILEHARRAGVRRVVQASSCAIYGNTERLPVGEAEPPDPLSPYAVTKLAAERLGTMYAHLYSTETVALRFFNVYGPRQDPTSPYAAVVPRFIAALAEGRQPTIYGDGQQTRDFIFVGDIVRALWTAATAPDIAGGVFNAGSGQEWSILQLAHIIGNALGVEVQPTFAPAREGEVRHSRADVSLFAGRADFHAATTLEDGLKTTVAAWQQR
jgi:nucleoside-diphosphate-sugar epimerase